MQVAIEDVGPCKKLLKVQIEKDVVDSHLDEKYGELDENVLLPGFRKGKVPRRLMERRFSKLVNEEVRQDVMTESFKEVLKEHHLRPVGEPEFGEELPDLVRGEPLEFEVTVQVCPQIDPVGYDEVTVEEPPLEIADAEVDAAVEAIRETKAQYEVVVDGQVEERDLLVCDCVVRAEEGEAWHGEDLRVVPATGTVGVLPVSNLTEVLVGAKTDDVRETTVQVPPYFEEEALRGKEAALKLTVRDIKRPRLPEVDEEFIKQFGVDTTEEFRTTIQERIRRTKEAESRERVLGRVVDRLLEANQFDLPEALVEAEVKNMIERERLRLARLGRETEDVEKDLDATTAEIKQAAERRCKIFFLLEAVGDKEKVEVADGELDAEVENLARATRRPVGDLRRELEDGDLLDQLRLQLREERVRAFLIEKATSTPAEGQPAEGQTESPEATDAPAASEPSDEPAAGAEGQEEDSSK